MKSKSFFLLCIFIYTFNCVSGQIVFTTNNREIQRGDSVLLTWSVDIKKALTFEIKDVAKNCTKTGSMYFKPDSSQSLKFVVKTKKKEFKKSIFIEVLSPTFKRIEVPERATDEELSYIKWETKNSVSVEIVGVAKNLPPVGDTLIRLNQTTPYLFVCHNKLGFTDTVSKLIKVTILESMNIPDSVFYNEVSKITWKYKNAKKVIVVGESNEFKVIDTLSIKLKTSQSYKIFVIRNSGDTIKFDKLVRVVSPIKVFKLPMIVYEGSSAVLKWELVEGFTANVVDLQKNIPAKGEIIVTPNVQNSYSIEIKEKNKVLFTKTVSTRVISPLIMFDVPDIAYINNEELIRWKVAEGYEVSISDIGENLKTTDNIKVIPTVNKSYTITVKKDGKLIETETKKMQVFNRREFVSKTIKYEDMKTKIPFDIDIFSIDNSKYPDEVSVSFLVVDTLGRYILDLDFDKETDIINKVTETIDDKEFPVKDFDIQEFQNQVAVPYDISMSLDYSGSMYDNINFLEEAAKNFISKKDKTDNISLFKFDDRVVQDCSFSKDVDYILENSTFNGLDTLGGSTALYAGADFAMQSFTNTKNQKILLLFTDGEENASFQYFGTLATSANDIVKKAFEKDVRIFVVAFGSGVNSDVLKQIAWLTGGSFYNVQKKSDINKVFKEMPIIMRNYYVLTYKPKSKNGFHEVGIFYDDEKNKEVSTKYSFFAGKDYNIDEYDSQTVNDTYWKKSLNTLGTYKPISVPQAVAFFDFDKSELLPEYEEGLDVYVEFLTKFPKAIAVIFGHTDSKGTNEYCMELSEKRAQTVYNYLIAKGIDKNRLSIIPCGKTEPIWNPDLEDWKSHENRRIEIMLAE